MMTTNYVMNMNLFQGMKMCLFMTSNQGLCEIIIDFIMLIDLQKNILIKQGDSLFRIPLQNMNYNISLMNFVMIKRIIN